MEKGESRGPSLWCFSQGFSRKALPPEGRPPPSPGGVPATGRLPDGDILRQQKNAQVPLYRRSWAFPDYFFFSSFVWLPSGSTK